MYDFDIKNKMNNETFQDAFYLKEFKADVARNKKEFANILLMNKNGTYMSKLWDLTEEKKMVLEKAKLILVKGTINEYLGNKQIIINNFKVDDGSKVDIKHLVKTSETDIDEIMSFINNTVDNFENNTIKLITKEILDKYSYEFRYIGGAKTNHHNYYSGLAEHTYNILLDCMDVSKRYKNINYDLLFAGAILHDIGKIKEFVYDSETGIVSDYTREGELIGHLVMGSQEVALAEQKLLLAGEEIDHKMVVNLQHLILSHHGKLEYGSPKLPSMPEADILSKMDSLDCYQEMFTTVISEIPDDQEFSSRQYALDGRKITSSEF